MRFISILYQSKEFSCMVSSPPGPLPPKPWVGTDNGHHASLNLHAGYAGDGAKVPSASAYYHAPSSDLAVSNNIIFGL